MTFQLTPRPLMVAVIGAAALTLAVPAQAADDEAMMAFLKKNECTKCHQVEKTKKGPSYKKIAAKYKGKADAEAKLNKHLTSSPKVKLEDGTEEEHKALEASKAQMNDLIKWILAQ